MALTADEALPQLQAREPLFHRPEFGTMRADFARMVVDDYWEVGASGKCYDRAFVLDVLERRHAAPHDDPWATSGFDCRALGESTFLLTYVLEQGQRITRRATVWRLYADGWKALYHQGTLVQEGETT